MKKIARIRQRNGKMIDNSGMSPGNSEALKEHRKDCNDARLSRLRKVSYADGIPLRRLKVANLEMSRYSG